MSRQIVVTFAVGPGASLNVPPIRLSEASATLPSLNLNGTINWGSVTPPTIIWPTPDEIFSAIIDALGVTTTIKVGHSTHP